MADAQSQRSFLFLQGPHGPFFGRLAGMIEAAGGRSLRVGFNAADRVFWPRGQRYRPFRGSADAWPATIAALLAEHRITDLVVYGDTRPVHASAVAAARAAGVTVHVFEEGYLRPWWATYERHGANGHSRLMRLSVSDMRDAMNDAAPDLGEAPAHWGDMRQHIFYGALYHLILLLFAWRYPRFASHRTPGVGGEALLHLGRLAALPWYWAERGIASRRIRTRGVPYHLVLLQLEHDSNFRSHSPFRSGADFITLVIDGFDQGAPKHHHLVFKAHPLADGRLNERRLIRTLARARGIGARVHYVRGGKLARLLDHARSAVTVNSTAAQQALWRGIPLRVFGAAVYAKPEFVSTQSLPDFFSAPARPDRAAYLAYRTYLLETSQIAGGFYSAAGRRQLLRQVVDLMLAPEDPYGALKRHKAAPQQHIRAVA